MGFKILETSSILVTSDKNFSSKHMEITDAMEAAVNYLGSKPSGSKVKIEHSIEIERLE